jgi:hypothetical protein
MATDKELYEKYQSTLHLDDKTMQEAFTLLSVYRSQLQPQSQLVRGPGLTGLGR